MKKRFLIIMALITLLTTCLEPGDGLPDVVDPNQKTTIVFDNTQGICAVTVYSSYQRNEESKIARIPAGSLSQEFEYYPVSSVPFFLSYQINFKGISGFTVDFVPEIGKDQIYVRVDPNIKTTITIPTLSEALSSSDALLSSKSYLLIQNNSSYSLQLLRGNSILLPDNMSETLVNSGERALYTINPGAASPYQLMVGGNNIPFPASLVSFESGRVYSFIYSNGALSLTTEIELKLENVAGVSPNKPVPEAPGVPVIIASDGLLTVQWTAIEGAEKYEVYISTTQNPPALPVKTVYSTVAVFTGLANKTVYYVWIKAVNENGSSDFSTRARGIPWPANEIPAIPGGLVIIPGINQLTVSWEDCGGASSYEVYINTTPSAPVEPVTTSDKTSAVISYLRDGNILENGVIYYIWVRAVNNVGKSAYSPVEAGTPRIPTVAPAAPSRPVLIAGSRELTVSWQTVELTSAYEVWFGTSSNSAQAQKFGGDISGGVTETVITGLVNETTYYVWIKAKNIVGTSGFSLPTSARTSAFVVLPETPGMPMVISDNMELSVSWQVIEGALFYEVWTGVINNLENAVKYGADISGTSVTLTGLVNETIYYIWLRAKNNIGISEFSPFGSGIPSDSAEPPQAPQSAPAVASGNRGLTLSWQAEEGASAYELWVGTTPNPITAVKQGNDVSALSGNITGLTNETTYYVWIKAKNSKGTSGFSPMASGTPSITPGLYRGVEKIGNQNLNEALSYISSNAVSGDDYYIVLGANESASQSYLSYSNKTVGITLMGYGGERTITLNSYGSLFTINTGITLTLDENITLVGRDSNSAPLVYVNSGSTLIINGGSVSGNTRSNDGSSSANMYGGGIYIAGGTFTMNSGSVSGNTVNGSNGSANMYGGGIYIAGGTFTMNGGIISGNTANTYGGGIYIAGGTFAMNGGTIRANTSGLSGGGICVARGTVTMYNGTISGNQVSFFGGGIFVDNGTFTMYGGTISGNTASGGTGYGGGISVAGGTFGKLPLNSGGQNSGIIYGSEAVGNDAEGIPLKNTARDGHAIYLANPTGNYWWRNATAGQTNQIDTTTKMGLSREN